MRHTKLWVTGTLTLLTGLALTIAACSRDAAAQDQQQQQQRRQRAAAATDAVQDAQTPRDVPQTRPEQQKNEHDRSDVFNPAKAPRSSSALENQPQKGEIQGFDFARDPLDSKRPMQPADEIVQKDIADKAKVMEAQRKLLESRYDLTPHLDPAGK